ARQIAERFQPDKIILFGSYAYGTPTRDSDVDLLVIMPTRNQIAQAVRIDEAIEPGFALDLLVRTPKTLEERLRWGDWFLREIVTRGKVLYEKRTAEWVRKAEDDFQTAQDLLTLKPLHKDQISFCCQQAIEKYLKACCTNWE